MLGVIIFLVIVVLALGGLAAYMYVKSRQQTATRQPGSGAAAILRGVLTAYTGGAFGAVSGARSAP